MGFQIISVTQYKIWSLYIYGAFLVVLTLRCVMFYAVRQSINTLLFQMNTCQDERQPIKAEGENELGTFNWARILRNKVYQTHLITSRIFLKCSWTLTTWC